jgi:N-methylhydantoinase A
VQRVPVGIGGTFSDLVAQDKDGRSTIAKVLTTPRDHSEGIMNAVTKAAVEVQKTKLFLHGSTIAINTVVERKGVRTALITTRGSAISMKSGGATGPMLTTFSLSVPGRWFRAA